MEILSTPRLHLVPLTGEILRRRLESDDFEVVVELPDGARTVSFGPQWPDTSVESYAELAAAVGDGTVQWRWVAVDRDAAHVQAVADVGARGPVADDGSVTVGCAVNADAQGRGLGTEAVDAVVGELLSQDGVSVVRSRTGPDDIAGQRVLENTGFARVGSHDDPDLGRVVLWERTT